MSPKRVAVARAGNPLLQSSRVSKTSMVMPQSLDWAFAVVVARINQEKRRRDDDEDDQYKAHRAPRLISSFVDLSSCLVTT